MKGLVLLIFVAILLSLGVVCLFYPQKLLAFNKQLKGNWIRPMPGLMGPKQEIWATRISGVGAILMAILVGYVLWTNR
jgi:hypothetical protein